MRLNLVHPESTQGQTKELLDSVQSAFGVVPNVAKVLANSASALEGYLAFSQAMANSRLGDKLHNQLKLATSEANSCEYCTSILSAIAPNAGLSADDILSGRTATSDDGRAEAALKFATIVLEERGKVSDAQLRLVRDAGFDDEQIVDIVASVVLGCFTNFVNNVADTELDVPRAEPVAASASATACGC